MRTTALILAKPVAGALLGVLAVVAILAVWGFISLGDWLTGKE